MWSSFSVSFAVLGILPSVASTLSYSLGYSGTAGLTWGWIIAFVGIQCVANSMAELSSSMPTSGGLYYCVGVLAPPRWAPFLAYITGWSNWLGLVSGSPSVNYGEYSLHVIPYCFGALSSVQYLWNSRLNDAFPEPSLQETPPW